MDWYVILIPLAAFIGAIIAGLLGYLDSGLPFNPRKFLPTFLRSLVAAAIFAGGYVASPEITGWLGILAAFAAGAGIDVIGNRLAGATVASQPGNLSPPGK